MDSMTILSSFCEIPLLNRILLFFYSLCQVTFFLSQNTVSNIFLGQQKISDSIVGSKRGRGVATLPSPLSAGLYQQMQFIAYKVTIIRAANITTELLFLLVMPFPRDSPGKIILHIDHQVNNYLPIFLSCNIKVTFNLLKEQFQ